MGSTSHGVRACSRPPARCRRINEQRPRTSDTSTCCACTMRKAQTKPMSIVPGQALGVVASNTRGVVASTRSLWFCASKSRLRQPPEYIVARRSVPGSRATTSSYRVQLEGSIQQVGPRSLPDHAEGVQIDRSPADETAVNNAKPRASGDLQDCKRSPSDAFEDGSTPSLKGVPAERQAYPVEPRWHAYEHTERLRYSKEPSTPKRWWTPEKKREAFARIRFNLDNHLEIGCVEQRAKLETYISKKRTQGLYVTGSSPESTNFLLRALLRSLSRDGSSRTPPETTEIIHVDAEFYNTACKVYDVIRGRLKCRWEFPRWRIVKEFLGELFHQ